MTPRDCPIRNYAIAGRELRLHAPPFPEELLDHARDERMPYWAELWPSARALAESVLSGEPPLAGKQVLEIGCGLGLAGLAAALAGAARVTFSDYFPEALAFAAANARLNGVEDRRFSTMLIDWREPAPGLGFEAIVGADLLYEKGKMHALLGAIEALLAPGGTAYIADPNRMTAEKFGYAAEERGFAVERRTIVRAMSLYVLSRADRT